MDLRWPQERQDDVGCPFAPRPDPTLCGLPVATSRLGTVFTVQPRPVLLLWKAGGTPMSIQLPPDVEASIRQKVQRGQFSDEGQVMREALQLLDERERQLETLRAKIRIGLDELDRGEGAEWTPELIERLN